MAPRWKGKDGKAKKDAEAEALKEAMSKIISELQSSLVESGAGGFLSDHSVLIAVEAELTDVLDKACFGRPVRTVEKDQQWFQLGLEEAFYLSYSLKCLKINGGNSSPQNDEELWQFMKSKQETFPCFYKAYSHFRMKNWVVRSGTQFGVDFVIYRHHPALVHSEYGALVLSDGADNDVNGRLRVWSDIHCTTRLLGSVAKTLLVLHINKNGNGDNSPLCILLKSAQSQDGVLNNAVKNEMCNCTRLVPNPEEKWHEMSKHSISIMIFSQKEKLLEDISLILPSKRFPLITNIRKNQMLNQCDGAVWELGAQC